VSSDGISGVLDSLGEAYCSSLFKSPTPQRTGDEVQIYTVFDPIPFHQTVIVSNQY
jgi:hypothetical protein